jgi:hypothetical protein
MVATRVSDPHCFNADPDTDPEFFLIADPDSGSGSRIRIRIQGSGFTTRNLICIFLIKNSNLLIPRPP